MRNALDWIIRMPSSRFERVRQLKAERRFSGVVELVKVVPDGMWDLSAIVSCDTETDAALVCMVRDGKL